ncbi:GntR family transcriptional regulator [Polaromonas sp.]|uniref:GntR family transcriptional regulator n=1 Tax=Polaromonas sp. TaxID=1869339 RepID=UPI002FCBD6C9
MTTSSVLAERLRADIDCGVWEPGVALRQEELAARYGASRIPVREALQLLHADGLVVVAPNRGACVASLRVDEIDEIFNLRVLLETHLLAEAIPQHSPKTLIRLEAAQKELELEDSRAGWMTGDRRFHEALYEPANRVRTLRLVLTLRGQVERYAFTQIGPHTRRAEWKREHRELIASVRAKDIQSAIRSLSDHLNETRTVVLRQIQTANAHEELS